MEYIGVVTNAGFRVEVLSHLFTTVKTWIKDFIFSSLCFFTPNVVNDNI